MPPYSWIFSIFDANPHQQCSRAAIFGQFSLPILPKLPKDSNVGREAGHLRASTTFAEVRAVSDA